MDKQIGGSRRLHDGTRLTRPWGILGESTAIVEILDVIERIGLTDVPVLVTGEAGVGKELVALALHAASGLRKHVVVNSAGLPEALIESEIFGHVRGAFTGADRDRRGLLDAADGGTFILDEIGDLPLPSQAKFLRALQDGEVRRLGSDAVSHVRVRLIAATNRDLTAGVKDGWFRADLYGRINGLTIRVPPLRERPDDIRLLAQHFLGDRSLPLDVLELLMMYSWPGNVRELQLKLRVACAFAGDGEIRPEHFPEDIRSAAGTSLSAAADCVGHPRELRAVERAYIEHVVCELHGNLSHAAQVLGIDRRTLRRKLKGYGWSHDELNGLGHSIFPGEPQ